MEPDPAGKDLSPRATSGVMRGRPRGARNRYTLRGRQGTFQTLESPRPMMLVWAWCILMCP